MCFHCAEGTAIEIAKVLATGQPISPDHERMPFFDQLYLLEWADLLPAIERLHTMFSHLDIDSSIDEQSDEMLCITASVCRVCDILVSEGFQAPQDQTLLASSVVARVLTWFFTRTPPVDPRVFPEHTHFYRVFCKDVFFTQAGGSTSRRRRDPRRESRCVGTLSDVVACP